MPARLTRLGVALLAVSLCAIGPAAQEPPPAAPQQPVFRSGVDSVTVDVAVHDREGKPVTDLTAADFEVREGGKVQAIETFKLVHTDDGRGDPRAAREILSFDEHRSETARPDNRLFVILLDDYHVRRENSMRVREQLSAFVRQLSPHDLVAVATPLSSVGGLTFSRNHVAVASMVMAFEGRKYDYTPQNAIEARYQTLTPEEQEQMRNNLTIAALSNLCEYLGTLRDGRKSLVYVSEGMSGSVPAGVRVRGGTAIGGRTLTGASGNGRDSYAFFENSSLLLDLQSKVFRAAARNNVSIYPLDPRGLTNFEFGLDDNVSGATDRRIVQESSDLLRVIADQTDGRALIGRNDPLPGLRQMVNDSSTYYLLSYNSSVAPRDGKFHEIQVRVRRRDVDVRARKGYWAYTAEDVARVTAPPKPESPAEISAAIDSLASASALGRGRAVSVWMGAARGRTEKATVTLAWEVPPATTGPAVTPADQVDHVSIVATTLSGLELFNGPVHRGATTGRAGGVVTFDAPAGPLRVRVTAQNAKGLRLDNEEEALEVPDFSAAGPQLTTPFLYRGRTARDLQQVRLAAMPPPAVTPVFSRSERLLIRFAAYGPAGTTPTVTMRLLNRQGGLMAALPAPALGADGGLESEFGLGAFPPGDYLVEIVAEVAGEKAKRLVGVRVTG